MKRQIVHCPNCGSLAERNHSATSQVETQCLTCDRLMIICIETGRVIESYSPGIYPHRLRQSSELSVDLLTTLSRQQTVS
jgi:hypothetical protein